jgi:hypothetical protein
MLSVDRAFEVDLCALWALDRLDLFLETVSIECEIVRLEQRHGLHADFDDVRRRVQRVRLIVLEQLHGLLAREPERVH